MLATVIYIGAKAYLIYVGITMIENEVRHIIGIINESKKSKKIKTDEEIIETYFVD